MKADDKLPPLRRTRRGIGGIGQADRANRDTQVGKRHEDRGIKTLVPQAIQRVIEPRRRNLEHDIRVFHAQPYRISPRGKTIRDRMRPGFDGLARMKAMGSRSSAGIIPVFPVSLSAVRMIGTQTLKPPSAGVFG